MYPAIVIAAGSSTVPAPTRRGSDQAAEARAAPAGCADVSGIGFSKSGEAFSLHRARVDLFTHDDNPAFLNDIYAKNAEISRAPPCRHIRGSMGRRRVEQQVLYPLLKPFVDGKPA
ncbi:MAG: hypothetical protein P4L90_11305 [Rhodopila sp.]|nr:hypothetical protein [Rhodopila sp.]